MEEITYEFKIKTPINETDSTINTLILEFDTLRQFLSSQDFIPKIAMENQNLLIDRMITNLNNLKYKEVE